MEVSEYTINVKITIFTFDSQLCGQAMAKKNAF